MDEAFIRKAVDCVNAHLSDCDFEHAQFMAEMGMARTTLADKLKLLTGLTPSAFISNVRLQAACRLIDEKKKIRIADLAYAVGFNDPKYFSSCFKKKFGLSPTEYMMKYDGWLLPEIGSIGNKQPFSGNNSPCFFSVPLTFAGK